MNILDEQDPMAGHEQERLEKLHSYSIMDTMPEDEFDAIVALASSICNTPIALISLVDEGRQWFKASKGLDVPETAREISFCQHTIKSDQIFEVHDPKNDERFSHNPLVTGYPHIGFYAGAPLITPDGYRLGSICVIDKNARKLTTLQQDALRTLAQSVMNLLELRRQKRELDANMALLRESEQRFKKIYENSPIGVALIDLQGRIQTANPAMERIWGYSLEQLRRLTFMDITHPDDLASDMELYHEVLDGRRDSYSIDKRYYTGDGRTIWGRLSVSLIKDAEDGAAYFLSMVEDITDKKEASTRLALSEQNYRELVESSQALLCVHNLEGIILRTNSAIEEKLGYTRGELDGMGLRKLLTPRHASLLEKYLKKIKHSRWTHGHFDIMTKSGETLYWTFRTALHIDAGRQPEVICYMQDRTREVQFQKELQRSEKRLKSLYQISSFSGMELLEQLAAVVKLATRSLDMELGIISQVDGSDYTVYSAYDAQGAVLAGQRFELGDTYCDITLKNKATTAISHMGGSTHVGHPCYDIFRLESYIGTPLSVGNVLFGTLAFTAARPHNGDYSKSDIEFVELLAAWVGRTIEQDQAYRKLVENKEKLKEAQKLARLGNWTINLKTEERFWSEETCRILEISPDRISESISLIFGRIHADDRELVADAIKGAREKGVPFNIEYRLKMPDGRLKFIAAKGERRAFEPGGDISVMGTIQDITEQMEAREQLVKAKELAEEAARLKQEFLANMSHEIRTPMNGILGFSRLLAQTELPEESRSFVDSIYNSAETLLVIVNDILDFSKIEAGKLNIENIHFSPKALLSSLEKLFFPRVDEKGLQLSFITDSRLPGALIGDPVRLHQILNNLLSNAIKFTDRGEVEVMLKVRELTADDCALEIRVRDTGIGIPANKLQTIFRSFEQADGFTTRRFGGTGLGLTIVKKLTDLMGGEINVESRHHEGSTFILKLELPIGKVGKIQHQQARYLNKKQLACLKGLRVLLAEDNLNNQILGRRYLNDVGCLIDIAPNGKVAVEKAAANTYDLVLMDIQMPEMDGIEATQQLRALPGGRGTMPVVAITAHALREEEEKYRKVGFDEYLSKPFRPDELYSLMLKVLKNIPNRHTAGAGQAKAPQPAARPEEAPNSSELKPELVNFEELQSFTMGDADFLKEMVQAYLKDLPGQISHVETALASSDWESLGRSAHSLKGPAAYLGMNETKALLNRIENYDGRRGDAEYMMMIRQAASSLRSALRELENKLKSL